MDMDNYEHSNNNNGDSLPFPRFGRRTWRPGLVLWRPGSTFGTSRMGSWNLTWWSIHCPRSVCEPSSTLWSRIRLSSRGCVNITSLREFQGVEKLHAMEALGGRNPSELLQKMTEVCPTGHEARPFFLFPLPAAPSLLIAHHFGRGWVYIRYVAGITNIVADILSRPSLIASNLHCRRPMPHHPPRRRPL